MKQTHPTSLLWRSSIPAFLWLALVLACTTLSASAGTWKHITMDGSFTDWAGVPVNSTDVEGDSLNGFDLKEIYVANDADNIYFMVTIYPSSTNTSLGSSYYHLFLDTDANPSTGLSWGVPGVGAEVCLEFGDGWGAAFSVTNGAWTDGNCTGVNFAMAPSGVLPNYAFEFKLSRSALMPDGTPAFTQAAINLGFATVKSDWSGEADYIPAGAYEMAPTPTPFTGTVNLVGLMTTPWRVNDSGTDLGTDWLVTGYDDTQPGWTSGPGLLGFNAPTGVYPAPVATTLASGHPTYYFVSHFPWNTDQNGAGLLVSNFLSAGAVFYLNGTEVKRVRMPPGPVTYATPATGGPAQPGVVELFDDLPISALVVGDNVLQVEVHPAAGATTSLVFGLALIASDNFPPRIVDPSLPADRTAREGDATTFDPGAVAGTGPFTYQWSKDTQPITGATAATLTLNPVVNTNAGSYSVEITGPKGLKTTSRAALLATTAEAVAISDPNLPADQTVVQGASASFTVAATGTLLTYQWYKGNDPLTNEVGAQLTLNNVALADSGTQYWVNVTNRLGGLPSRKATLTVSSDATAPWIRTAAGGGRRVVITFSEPLDPISSQLAATYQLDGDVQVQGAVLDPVTGTTVTLTTAQQSFGQVYKLSVTGVKDRFGNAASASTIFRSTILIDGDFTDWSSIPVAFTKDQTHPGTADFRDISITNDTDYLYIRFSFYEPVGPLWDYNAAANYWQVAFDMDNNPTTSPAGFNGAEAVDEMNAPFRMGPSWSDGNYLGADGAIAPAFVTGTNFEIRVSLRATHEVDHSLMFPMAATNGTIGVFCCIRSTGWAALDTTSPSAPYTFGTFPPMPTTIMARLVGNKIELTWPGVGVLQSCTSLTTGNWLPVTGAASGIQIPATGPASYYRVLQ